MPVSRTVRLAALACTLVLTATACGAGADTTAGTTDVVVTTATAPPNPTSAPPAGQTVPEKLAFTAKTVGGGAFDGASLAGKPAVLWFWAPWCPKCQREASGVAAAAAETDGKVSFVGVAAQDTEDAMREFIDKRGVGGFPHIADVPDAALWQRFGVTAQPAYAFVGADGEIEVVTQQLGEDDLLARARALAGA